MSLKYEPASVQQVVKAMPDLVAAQQSLAETSKMFEFVGQHGVTEMQVPAPLGPAHPTLEATQGQILSQSPTDATRFWWHLYGAD